MVAFRIFLSILKLDGFEMHVSINCLKPARLLSESILTITPRKMVAFNHKYPHFETLFVFSLLQLLFENRISIFL